MKIKSEFHREFCSGGRSYLLGKDIYTRYKEADKIKKLIKENIKEYILIDAAVRITLDSPDIEGERLVISTPFLANTDGIISNLVDLLFVNFNAYYFSANNKINHYGISNTIMEGFNSSGLRRELELICNSVANRHDLAGRVIAKVNFENIQHAMKKPFVFSHVLQEKLDIHLGYRIVLYGPNINSQNFFIPILNDDGVLQQVYNNIESILHQNFVTYDEIADQGYLRVSNNLIMKELLSLLQRGRNKENIRKKLIHGVKFSTVLTNDPLKRYGEIAGDYVYDTINKVDNKALMDASDRSRALYDTFAFRVAWDTEKAANHKTIEEYDDIILFRNELKVPTSAGVQEASSTINQANEEKIKTPIAPTTILEKRKLMAEAEPQDDVNLENDDFSIDSDSDFEEI